LANLRDSGHFAVSNNTVDLIKNNEGRKIGTYQQKIE
jgi:hypothetical protein